MRNPLTQAILFIPTGPSAARWMSTCTEYALKRGYTIVSVVTVWADVIKMVRAGHATVVVVGRRDHLPPKREPRLEVVTEAGPEVPPEQRRAVRRPAEH